MDLYFMIIFILWLMNEGIACTFLSQIRMKALEIDQVLYDADEPSVLQCTHRCMLIDKTSIVEYKASKCRCVKYKSTGDDEMDSTMTGYFVKKPIKALKIDGGWSNWTSSFCTATCGNGTITQYRTCTAPKPKNGGLSCIGNKVQTVRCEMLPCPIDGGFSGWVNDGQCSVTCGGGQLSQERSCTNPSPQHGGKACHGDTTRNIVCNEQDCPCTRRTTTAGTCCRENCRWMAAIKATGCYDVGGKRRKCA